MKPTDLAIMGIYVLLLNIYISKWLCQSMIISSCQLAHNHLEDSFFICEKEKFFGVADGVGGWRTEDIDPFKFSSELMKGCESLIHSKGLKDLKEIVSRSYENGIESGASTFCIAKLEDGLLTTLTLGDSCCFVVRDKIVVFKTQELLHGFNHPFQIARRYGEKKKDKPDDAIEENFKVAKGDILFLATDGLTDNLYDYEIFEELDKDDLAGNLANKAKENAYNETKKTPFSEKSGKLGGKPDDITLVGIKLI